MDELDDIGVEAVAVFLQEPWRKEDKERSTERVVLNLYFVVIYLDTRQQGNILF